MRKNKKGKVVCYPLEKSFITKENCNPFLIISQKRSASTNLCYKLNQHPQINCGLEEIANPTMLGKNRPFKKWENKKEVITDFLFSNSRKVNGFKVFPEHVNFIKFKRFLCSQKDIKLIYLRRNCLWDMIISATHSTDTRIWSNLGCGYPKKISPLEVHEKLSTMKPYRSNISRFKVRAKEFIIQRKILDDFFSKKSHFLMRYEDSIKNDFSGVFKFLKVKNVKVKNHFEKLNKNQMYINHIKNYSHLKEIYQKIKKDLDFMDDVW